LNKNSFNKIVYFINDDNDSNKYLDGMVDNNDIIPVISISNKDGTNIENLHKIIYNIKPRDKFVKENDKTVVYLDSNFNVPGIGLVVSGTIRGKNINVKDKMFIGPVNGEFYPITIRSIHNSIREDVNTIGNGVQGCFAIKFTNSKQTLTRNQIKKGFVLIDNVDSWKENIIETFTAKIRVLHHSSMIKTGYSPVIHCGPIRQSATIKLIDGEYLKSQENGVVRFKFRNHKEFVEKNMVFFFRDGLTKGVGEII
jgi:elongation factor 1-alpha